MVDFGSESCDRVWSKEHRMGGRHGEAGGRRRHTGHRVEPSSHVVGGQGAGCETVERAGQGKSISGSGEHSWGCRVRSRVLPGGTGQGIWCHCKENKDLRSVNKMLEWWDQREEERAGKRKEEETQVDSNSAAQGRIAEVDSESNRQNVEWPPEEPEGSQGMENSGVCQPAGRSDCGGLDRQRWETREYCHSERKNAETRVLSPESARPGFRTAPSGVSAPVHHWVSGRTSPYCPVWQISPRPRQAVFWGRTPTQELGENANHGTSQGSCPNRPTPSRVEAGEQGCDMQARKERLHEAQGVSLHSSTKLYGESCPKCGCKATGWRGWKKSAA